MNKPVKIYFAHAIVDYDSEYEDLCIKTINKFYKNCTINNPKEMNMVIEKELPEITKFKLYFFPAIDECDIVIAAPAFNHPTKKGRFPSGTIKEMMYALKINKPVIALINDELKEIKNDFFNQVQWDVFGWI